MPAERISVSGLVVDLSSRVVTSTTVAGSPAAAAETTIATITVPANAALGLGVLLFGWAAFTVGTSGTAARMRIRRTDTSGAIQADTGATTGGIAATNLVVLDAGGLDTGATLPGQVYVLTLTITAGAAASTVSGVQLVALAI